MRSDLLPHGVPYLGTCSPMLPWGAGDLGISLADGERQP